MTPFYITVTNAKGATLGSDPTFLPHKFRLYCNPKTNEFVGQQCLLNAVKDPRAAETLFYHMIQNESGTWHHLSWERK